MAGIEHRHLRSALDFAVVFAGEAQKRRAAVPFPKELKPFIGKSRLPSGSLGKLRRAIENDPEFRSLLASGAVPEVVDDVGRLWLAQPTGWEDDARRLIAEGEATAATRDLDQALKRAEKRRLAAEQATARTRVELLQQRSTMDAQELEIDELRAELGKVAEEAAELRAELIDTRNEVRHARDREQAAVDRAAAAASERDSARTEQARATEVRDDLLASRVDTVASIAEIESAAAAAQSLANRLESLLPSRADGPAEVRPAQRTPLSLPGGVISTSAEAADFLVRSDAVVLIDGYNVAKLAWASRTLEQQRNGLLDAVENLSRRYGTDVTVVFDGTTVVGAHTVRRRLVRVVYSPEGVLADDVIRDEVRRLPTTRPVVVVTNDQEIIRDVRADGANTLPSNALLAIL